MTLPHILVLIYHIVTHVLLELLNSEFIIFLGPMTETLPFLSHIGTFLMSNTSICFSLLLFFNSLQTFFFM